ncbi:DNA repair and recombination protein RAD54B [Camponotus floridanus]|uniref:DNA repair and recombination protein RAD54B n=1 Tax=Camponotus floridanus TaxID=104421 RepID=UPI00059E6D87|nr:DNA repair and recombination protein RAD54B [Camponotus floridanus]
MHTRSNAQLLSIFEKTSPENEVTRDNIEVENNVSKKEDVNSSVYEKNTSINDLPQTESKIIFNVMYGRVTSKKYKTWDGDGFLEITGKNAILKDMDGKVIGKKTINPNDAVEGSRLNIGNKQIEIKDQVSQESPIPEEHSKERIEEPPQKKFKASTGYISVLPKKEDAEAPVYRKETSSTNSSPTKISKIIFNVMYGQITSKKNKTWDGDGLLEIIGENAILKDFDGKVMGKKIINPNSAVEGSRLIVGNKQIEIIDKVSQEEHVEETVEKVMQEKIEASTDVFTKGLVMNCEPLVMPCMNTSACISHEEQKVSVDFCLTAKLREHQRYGIVFLYECLMGLKVPDYFGAILADEMGLGKTLQCITLIWTMLKKGPYGKPIVRRVLIITPRSLCNNWDKEFRKWLGCHRISPYVVDGKNRPKDFIKHPRNSVLIISYEMLVKSHVEIKEITFDLLVCDEGHRLKNSNIKAAKLLHEINCKKRIMLTGTPIQNDLKEFYTLVDFVNPGILGSPLEYKNYYEDPIVASQCPNADKNVLSLGSERATELHERTKSFILRRTQNTINKYLPCKYEIVLFCSLTSEQMDLYSLVTDAWFNKTCLQDKNHTHLSIIIALKKICNHPNLFINDKENTLRETLSKAICTIQLKQDKNFIKYCGKITILQVLMRNLKKTDEKLVLVSYYTQTLDLFETICNIEELKFLRLDGTISSSTRSKIIEQFNTRSDNSKILLLSAKAGGVGLNLPGASRLVLFDSDWNPASDVQAMARIWRDGQKKNVYIYRLLTTGTIEEKIYQRQISKASLSESVVDLNHLGSLKLSTAELKDLFTLATDTISLTHDLLNCSCTDQDNGHITSSEESNDNEMKDYQSILDDKPCRQNLTINQLRDWQHYKQPIPLDIMQDMMLTEASDYITFIFKNSTYPN